MNITVLNDRNLIIDTSDNFGTQNENKATVLNFNFPDNLMKANKKIVFITDDGNYWDLIENNSYKITNAVTKYKNVSAYVWLVDTENDIDFRSKIWNLDFNQNKNPDDVVPSEEEIDAFDTMIAQLNSAIEKVDNVDIDLSKVENITTITITDKEGIEKTAEIEDGKDYIITQEDYEAIADIVESDTSENYYNKTQTDSFLADKVDKVTGKGLSTEDYTTSEKNKLANIENNAEVNVIEEIEINGTSATISGKKATINIGAGAIDSISVNGTPQTIDANKNVNITVPTKTSDITNDSGFIDNSVNNLINYYDKSTVDSKLSSVYKYKGTVLTYSDLPSTGLTVGDVYNIETADSAYGIKAGDNVAWNGSYWDILAGTVDLSGYQTKIDSSHKLNSDLVDDTNNTHKFVTSAEKTQITTNTTDISNIKDGTNIDSFGDVETALSNIQVPEEVVISSTAPVDNNWKLWIDENEQEPQYVTQETFDETIGDLESLLAEV